MRIQFIDPMFKLLGRRSFAAGVGWDRAADGTVGDDWHGMQVQKLFVQQTKPRSP